ncbi:MAG TPA: serine hydrolase domain-containing protein [Jatrophihabitans sp.]|nr:serine hydrolase domain-containing protein [Jatrophihabitans sp.]
MSTIEREIDPAAAGFDPDRLARLDRRLARFIDDGQLPGWQVVISRHGKVVHASCRGERDVARHLPIEPDTIYRIFSMTKPGTALAAMLLVEQGELLLTDPISRWLPEYANPRIYVGGSDLVPDTVPATEPIRVRHLLTHTAGFAYAFLRANPVAMMYRNAGLDEFTSKLGTLAEMSEQWGSMPLVFEPGTQWQYSIASDVLGRLIEVVSGSPLDAFFDKHILGPLGMADTAFRVPEGKRDRLAELYLATPAGFTPATGIGEAILTDRWLSGGAGLVSTAHDFRRFSQLLLRDGELDGVRLLAPATARLMHANQLPGGGDLASVGRPVYAEFPMQGMGFGLSLAPMLDVAASGMAGSVGDYGWGGFASTVFVVDPALDLTYEFYTQLMPSSALPIRPLLRQLIHQAIVA